VSKKIPCEKIYEDKDFLAFLDINPINQGHTLVIPKKHSRTIFEMDDKNIKEIIIIVRKIANKIKKALKADGINIMINNESAAGQIIFHTHIHIIPRFSGDNLKHWPGQKYKPGEAQSIAKKIITTV
jgi:histidine triad (HIT) family protein